jgi:crotonobetaine/carnitine-CoA ligase
MGLAPWGGPEESIGMPMDYVEYGVVDEEDRLLPPGSTGELVLSMPPHFMFERYLGDEAATRRAMRGGFFHTGDRMRLSADGLLAHRGRVGERLRHHGENVDPRAIELAALAQPGVREAAAYGVPGALGDDDMKLDVVAEPGLDLAKLRVALAAQLPKKSLPRYLERRDGLPRSGTFKILKHRLRDEGVNRPGILDAEG